MEPIAFDSRAWRDMLALWAENPVLMHVPVRLLNQCVITGAAVQNELAREMIRDFERGGLG